MLIWPFRESWVRDTLWLQRAAAALTAMLRPPKTKMVSHSLAFRHMLLQYPIAKLCLKTHIRISSPSSLAFCSEEKIRRRLEVQQPHEHWQEEALRVREPREMCGHLRWAEIWSTCTDCTSYPLTQLLSVLELLLGDINEWLLDARLNMSIFSHMSPSDEKHVLIIRHSYNKSVGVCSTFHSIWTENIPEKAVSLNTNSTFDYFQPPKLNHKYLLALI